MSDERYTMHMENGYNALSAAWNEENKSHSGIKTLAQAMHDYWDIAEGEFSMAAAVVPTANIEWATAVELMLLAKKMKETYKIPQ